jgi:hypothetical protein
MNETTTTSRRNPTEGNADPPRTADVARDRAQEVASTAADQAKDVTQTAKAQVEVVASEARDHAQHLARRTREELQAQADERASQFSASLRDVGSQLRSLANGNAQEGVVADLSRDFGHRIQGVADRIDQGGVEGVLDDVRQMARRHPGMFLAGAAAAGFLATRMFRDLQEVQSEDSAHDHRSNGHLTRGESYRPTAAPVGTVDPTGGPAVMPLADSGLTSTAPPVVGSSATGPATVDTPLRPDGAS